MLSLCITLSLPDRIFISLRLFLLIANEEKINVVSERLCLYTFSVSSVVPSSLFERIRRLWCVRQVQKKLKMICCCQSLPVCEVSRR